MQALFIENKELILKDTARPQPTEGEALVKIHLAGICNTDLEICKGYFAFKGILKVLLEM
jgi:D-arabinose 1-dehydrogenase-like Zn-dependent alcohol dehydrogenase